MNQQTHRPGPLHQTNKPYKAGRHSGKNSTSSDASSKTSRKSIKKLNRHERINQAVQTRKLKKEKNGKEKRRLGLNAQPPLTIGVLDIHLNSCQNFFKGIANYDDASVISVKEVDSRSIYVISNRLKTRFKLVVIDSTKFDESLDTIKTIDLLLLLHNSDLIQSDGDSQTQHLLSTAYIHCMPTKMHVIYPGQSVESLSKRLLEAKRILKNMIKDDKIFSIEKSQDYLQLFHSISRCKRSKSMFKDARSTIVTDRAEVIGNTLAFTGFVRHKTLNVNDLIHVVGYDDYQIEKIDILPDIVSLRQTSIEGSTVVQTLVPDLMKQESLEQENDVDPMEGEQTWPTAEELAAEAERRNTRKIIKKLPAGFSEYQGAWIPEESDDDEETQSGSENEDFRDAMADIPECEEGEEEDREGNMDIQSEEDEDMSEDMSAEDEDENDECGDEHDDDQMAMDEDKYDKSNSRDKEMKVLEKLREARLEEMFPDEQDTPSDVPARVRFARYRGLKSFRTSQWDPQENLPPDYSKIFQFQNFQQTKRRVLSNRERDGADPGQYVRIYLSAVPDNIKQQILQSSLKPNLIALLKHERKMTVMNFLIKRLPSSNLENPIKSKDELIFYVGFRKFKARPLFTTHSVSSKFKYERFLRDDVAMVATMYAPITFPAAPVLVFRTNYRGEKELVASGTVLDSNPNRLIVKRIRLSGHPYKIHSKTAVIRFMFFNNEDVTYFKPVELITKYSRRGHITEPLGTHGHMKCTFDKKIRSDDCVFMNLYKRVFPKWTYTPIQGLDAV